jgi:hypothetical protein
LFTRISLVNVQPLHELWREGHVAVDEHEDLAPSGGGPGVPGAACAQVVAADERHVREPLGDELGRAVARAVVDHDDLERLVALVSQGAEALVDVPALVVHGQHHGDHGLCHLRSSTSRYGRAWRENMRA